MHVDSLCAPMYVSPVVSEGLFFLVSLNVIGSYISLPPLLQSSLSTEGEEFDGDILFHVPRSHILYTLSSCGTI